MKTLLRLLLGLVVLVLLLVVVAFFLPRQYRVERSTVIAARPETIYANLADLRAWKQWGVWFERDPQMTLSYSENQNVVGAWSAWDSKTEGKGKMTIAEMRPPTFISYGLEFPDFGMKSTGSLTLTPEGNNTKVLWADAGDLGVNPVNRYFGLFLDSMLGPDFEKGLAKLKTVSETKAR